MARLHPDRPPRPLVLGGRPLPVIGPLRAYACGITPYDVTHLGHAATYLWTDAAVRVLAAEGTPVVLARNVTDVDEALFAEAGRRGEHYDRLAAMQKFSFDRTMTALRVRPPDHEPSARQQVHRVVELAAALLAGGHAYQADGQVYARTAAAAGAAGIGEDRARQLAAEYGDDPDDPRKEHPLDVAVWRSGPARPAGEAGPAGPARPGGAEPAGEAGPGGAAAMLPEWPSPWGPGRPGWHAECAAMVLGTFGGGVDLHTGGADLAYPHHACEALLAEAAVGVRPFARAWLRAGTVQVAGAKMAKSTGNLVLVDDLLRAHSPAAVRLLCLHRRWDQPWDFDPGELDRAAGTLESLYAAAAGGAAPAAASGADGPAGAPAGEVDAVQQALLADLDVPRAVALALDAGGAAARHLLDVLALG